MEFKEKVMQNIEKAADATVEFVTAQQQRLSKIIEANKLEKELSNLYEEYGKICFNGAADDALEKKAELEEKIKTCLEHQNELSDAIDEFGEDESIVYCSKCGEKYDITENFCSKCGAKLNKR